MTRIVTFNMFKDIQYMSVTINEHVQTVDLVQHNDEKEPAACISFDAREHEACINRSVHVDEGWGCES